MAFPRRGLAAGAFLVVLGVLAVGGCRRTRLPRGDAAAVVVVSPRHDAHPGRNLSEREPNDSPEQAQVLALNSEWPLMDVDGVVCTQPDQTDRKDVDVFKLVIPGGSAEEPAPSALDSAAPGDLRRTARRLAVEIATEVGGSVGLQFLDEGLKVVESVVAEDGEPAGMPNMAVQPGQSYYIRVKAMAKTGKQAAPAASCKYKLSVELGAFDVADEREPNDTPESAESVTLSGVAELAGYYGWHRDQDVYRLPSPEVSSALDVVVDAVDGVTPGLQVLAGNGAKLAVAKGRRGETLALHNIRVDAAAVDGGAASTSFLVVVKAESGQNRSQRYVLHLSLGALKQGTEIEPNDAPGNATPIGEGMVSGFLPTGDVDYFLYDATEPREISVELAFPARVRGKLELSRPSTAEVLASAETKKARQRVSISKILNLGQPMLFRLAPVRGDGNANEPYRITISSVPSTAQAGTPEIRVAP
jgi:hypothetical protein